MNIAYLKMKLRIVLETARERERPRATEVEKMNATLNGLAVEFPLLKGKIDKIASELEDLELRNSHMRDENISSNERKQGKKEFDEQANNIRELIKSIDADIN